MNQQEATAVAWRAIQKLLRLDATHSVSMSDAERLIHVEAQEVLYRYMTTSSSPLGNTVGSTVGEPQPPIIGECDFCRCGLLEMPDPPPKIAPPRPDENYKAGKFADRNVCLPCITQIVRDAFNIASLRSKYDRN